MTETRTEVKAIQVDMPCPRCETGKMNSTGVVLTSYPPQYPHRCDKCRQSEIYDQIYPHLEYEQ